MQCPQLSYLRDLLLLSEAKMDGSTHDGFDQRRWMVWPTSLKTVSLLNSAHAISRILNGGILRIVIGFDSITKIQL